MEQPRRSPLSRGCLPLAEQSPRCQEHRLARPLCTFWETILTTGHNGSWPRPILTGSSAEIMMPFGTLPRILYSPRHERRLSWNVMGE